MVVFPVVALCAQTVIREQGRQALNVNGLRQVVIKARRKRPCTVIGRVLGSCRKSEAAGVRESKRSTPDSGMYVQRSQVDPNAECQFELQFLRAALPERRDRSALAPAAQGPFRCLLETLDELVAQDVSLWTSTAAGQTLSDKALECRQTSAVAKRGQGGEASSTSMTHC